MLSPSVQEVRDAKVQAELEIAAILRKLMAFSGCSAASIQIDATLHHEIGTGGESSVRPFLRNVKLELTL